MRETEEESITSSVGFNFAVDRFVSRREFPESLIHGKKGVAQERPRAYIPKCRLA
jgi:hypothetical protein